MPKAKPTLPSELLIKLRKDILSEKIIPGSKLTESQLCEKYSVSRTPIREALHALESEHLIELIPNRGAFAIGLSRGDISDLSHLRLILEVQAVRWAIERIYEGELEELEQTLDFMEYYTKRKDTGRIRELDMTFHQGIWLASHNKQIADELLLYRTYLRSSAHTKRFSANTLDAIHEEHDAIFEAFLNNDPDAGAAAMRLHIENSIKRSM